MFNIFKSKKKENKLSEKELLLKEQEDNYNKLIKENVDIHVMPKKFHLNHLKAGKAKKAGIVIIAIGVIFLVGASFLLYYFLLRPTKPIVKAPETITPTEKSNENQITENQTANQNTENNDGTSLDKKATSTPKDSGDDNSTPKQIVVADADNDGLSDAEEMIFGSDLNNPDTDNDGFDDLLEILNLYNAANFAPRRLADNVNISVYTNNTYSYSLYYPTAWQKSVIGSDDSIMFKSSDNQFMQTIVQQNRNRESIRNWYFRQFNTRYIEPNNMLYGYNYEGVRSEDGLTLYITDDNEKYIYVLSYNPGVERELKYKNIFEMMIKSFEIK